MSAPARTCRGGGGEGGGGHTKARATLKHKNPRRCGLGDGKISWHLPWPGVSKQNLPTCLGPVRCTIFLHVLVVRTSSNGSNVKLVPDDPNVTSWLILTRICFALSTLERSGTTDHVLHTATIRDTFWRCSIVSKHQYFDFK